MILKLRALAPALLAPVLLTLAASFTAQAAEPTAESELKRFVNDVSTLSARFVQTQADEAGRVVSTSAGRMLLSRPGRFRWAYEQPYEQLMVCDGKKIWMYDPDLSQVTVRPAEATLGGTPAALLAQKSDLAAGFVIGDLGRSGGLQGAKLTPRDADSDFAGIEIWLRDGAPQRMVFLDRLGNRNEVTFSEIKVNQRVDESQLKFTPPKGVEVIDTAAKK